MQNVQIGVVWGRWGSLKVIGNGTVRYSAYDFLFDFNRNYASTCILCRFRDVSRYLSKVADFNPPHLYLASSSGATPVEFRGDLWRQKTKAPVWFSFCDLAFSRFSSWNTDLWQTQTDRHRAIAYTYRASIASRGKKYKKLSYRRGTARCVVSVEILPIATQQ